MTNHKFDLQPRLINFAVSSLTLIERLPDTMGARILAHQLAKSSTSAALNYGEVQANESPKDFIHKMSICLKELRESQISMTIILHKLYLPEPDVLPTLKECSELVAIFFSSIKTKKQSIQQR